MLSGFMPSRWNPILQVETDNKDLSNQKTHEFVLPNRFTESRGDVFRYSLLNCQLDLILVYSRFPGTAILHLKDERVYAIASAYRAHNIHTYVYIHTYTHTHRHGRVQIE
jgi:hypothetical protein